MCVTDMITKLVGIAMNYFNIQRLLATRDETDETAVCYVLPNIVEISTHSKTTTSATILGLSLRRVCHGVVTSWGGNALQRGI